MSVIRASLEKIRKLCRCIVAEVKKIERKVMAAGLWGLLGSMVVALLTQVQGNEHLLDFLPPQAKFVALAVLPSLAAFVGAWAAKHTPRPGADGE